MECKSNLPLPRLFLGVSVLICRSFEFIANFLRCCHTFALHHNLTSTEHGRASLDEEELSLSTIEGNKRPCKIEIIFGLLQLETRYKMGLKRQNLISGNCKNTYIGVGFYFCRQIGRLGVHLDQNDGMREEAETFATKCSLVFDTEINCLGIFVIEFGLWYQVDVPYTF